MQNVSKPEEGSLNSYVFLKREIRASERMLAKPPKSMKQRSLQIVRGKLMVMRATLEGIHPEAEIGDDDHEKWLRSTITMLGTDVYEERVTSVQASLLLGLHLNTYDR